MPTQIESGEIAVQGLDAIRDMTQLIELSEEAVRMRDRGEPGPITESRKQSMRRLVNELDVFLTSTSREIIDG